jgi:hypothetical protein
MYRYVCSPARTWLGEASRTRGTLQGRALRSSGGWSPGDPASSPGRIVPRLRWTKWKWGRFSPSTPVFSANRSTDYSTLIFFNHPVLVQWANRPNGGRRAEWTQSHLKEETLANLGL